MVLLNTQDTNSARAMTAHALTHLALESVVTLALAGSIALVIIRIVEVL